MQKLEKSIGLQNRRPNDALFIVLKLLQFFKVTIFEESDAKGLKVSKQEHEIVSLEYTIHFILCVVLLYAF